VSGYDTPAPLNARIAIHRYGANPEPWYDFVHARLPAADRLLDAGAGTGALWAGPRPGLTLLDRSAGMCAKQKGDGHTTVQGSLDALPFRDAAYGGALACHVLYHVPEPRRALAELHRVVRPGGWVAVATNGRGHMREISDLAERAGLPRGDVHERFAAEDAPAALAEWFTEVAVHPFDDTLTVPDAAPVVAYVASWFDRPLTPDEERTISDGVGDGPLRVTKHTVLVTARR
jgi:SAM-dependent methyltransferase